MGLSKGLRPIRGREFAQNTHGDQCKATTSGLTALMLDISGLGSDAVPVRRRLAPIRYLLYNIERYMVQDSACGASSYFRTVRLAEITFTRIMLGRVRQGCEDMYSTGPDSENVSSLRGGMTCTSLIPRIRARCESGHI